MNLCLALAGMNHFMEMDWTKIKVLEKLFFEILKSFNNMRTCHYLAVVVTNVLEVHVVA